MQPSGRIDAAGAIEAFAHRAFQLIAFYRHSFQLSSTVTSKRTPEKLDARMKCA
jgi:hypothetical protein